MAERKIHKGPSRETGAAFAISLTSADAMLHLAIRESAMIGLAMMLAAAEPGAYHLVVTYQGGGTVVIDYPSQSRCERALVVLEADLEKRIAESKRNAPPGGAVIGLPYHYVGMCLPA